MKEIAQNIINELDKTIFSIPSSIKRGSANDDVRYKKLLPILINYLMLGNDSARRCVCNSLWKQ